jgi:hypothetical protein
MLLAPHGTHNDRDSDKDGGGGDDPGDDFDGFEFVAFGESAFEASYPSAFDVSQGLVYEYTTDDPEHCVEE